MEVRGSITASRGSITSGMWEVRVCTTRAVQIRCLDPKKRTNPFDPPLTGASGLDHPSGVQLSIMWEVQTASRGSITCKPKPKASTGVSRGSITLQA